MLSKQACRVSYNTEKIKLGTMTIKLTYSVHSICTFFNVRNKLAFQTAQKILVISQSSRRKHASPPHTYALSLEIIAGVCGTIYSVEAL